MTPTHPDLQVAIDAVRDAAKLTSAVQKELAPESLEKKDRSPVTIADFGSQALVLRRIGEAHPNNPVIAEEGSAALQKPENETIAQTMMEQIQRIIPDATFEQVCGWIDRGQSREYASRFWTLDPIDGTKGFLRGEQYAVSLALVEEGELKFGLLACPNISEYLPQAGASGGVFFAIKGQGAWLLPDGASEPLSISTSGVTDFSQARFVESFESGHSDHSWSGGVASSLKVEQEPVRLDSQAKYAILAAGSAEIYLRLPTKPGYVEKIWDHAGGALIIEEAGGTVTDIFGNPLDWSQGYRLEKNKGVVATGGGIHDEVIAAINASGAPPEE